jgi:hypothetical protein
VAAEAFALAERASAVEEARTELQDALARTQQRLDEVSGELQTLRDSRLFRWTSPVRSAYYRARRVGAR